MLKWFESYSINRKQCIQINKETKRTLEDVKFGVLQGSILGPLLFLIYVNDLQHASRILQTIIFSDDTNLFYERDKKAERDKKIIPNGK